MPHRCRFPLTLLLAALCIGACSNSGSDSGTRLSTTSNSGGGETATVIERCQNALGPWPTDAEAVVAEGTSNLHGMHGTFRLLVTRDGRYSSLLDSARLEWSAFDGEQFRFATEARIVWPGAPYLRRWLLTWSAGITHSFFAGQNPGIGARLADGSADTTPTLVLTHQGEDLGLIDIDPETDRPTTLRFHANRPGQRRDYATLANYRRVGSTWLPHRFVVRDQGEFTVSEWTFLTEIADEEFSEVPATGLAPAPPTASSLTKPSIVKLRARDDGGFECPVALNGQRPVWLVLMPGAVNSYLTETVQVANEEIVAKYEGGRRRSRLDTFEVGALTLHDLHMQRYEVGGQPNSHCGILRHEFLMHCCAELDTATGTLTLYPTDTFADVERDWVPVWSGSGHLQVEVAYDAKRTVVGDFDVSYLAPAGLMVHPSFHALHGLDTRAVLNDSESLVRVWLGKETSLELPSFLPRDEDRWHAIPADGCLRFGPGLNCKVYFDLSRHRLAVEPID